MFPIKLFGEKTKSLGPTFAGYSIGVVSLGIAALLCYDIYSAEKELAKRTEMMLSGMVRLVETAVENDMAQGNMAKVEGILSAVSKLDQIERIFITDPKGRPRLYAGPHPAPRPVPEDIIRETVGTGKPVSRIYPNEDNTGYNVEIYHPIKDEKSCRVCHQDPEKIRGLLVLHVHADWMLSAVKKARIKLMSAGLAVLALLAAVIFWLTKRRITLPLRRLRNLAAKIASGDYTTRANVKTPDELGDLSESLDIMADSVQKHSEIQNILNGLLRLSLEDVPLKQLLESSLNKILTASWLAIEAKGAIFLTDEKTNSLKMAASAGLGEFVIKTCAEVPAGRCLCGRALLSGEPVFKPHVDGDHENSYAEMTDHGHYIIPITADGRVYGVITVYLKAGYLRSGYDIAFLSAVADILAGAIHRKELSNHLFLKDLLTKALNAGGDKTAFKALIDDICKVTGWPVGEVWLPDNDKLYLYRASSCHAAEHRFKTFCDQSGDFRFRKGEGLPGRVWESKESAWVQDVTKEADFLRKTIALSCGIKAAVAVPIQLNGEVAAVLNFFIAEAKPADEELVNFLSAAAGQMGLILQQNLLSEQLVQAQKMETVGNLAGGIAHDFNNILGAISGYTEFLIKDLKDMPQQLADALEVRKAAERAAALTRQLLTFSRKNTAVKRILNLNDAIKGLSPMLKQITGENIKLEIAYPKNIPLIKMDPIHLEQVVMNLVVNARDAMPAGGAITIKTGETGFTSATAPAGLEAGKYATLSVSDTGTGMSEEVKKSIFEPFFTTKPPGKGTGLGLSVVHGIIKQNNALITVDTVLNKGTTFTIYLPAASDGETAAAPESRGQVSDLKGSETILIAEDDEASRSVLLRVLKEHGYNVLAAANAGEALALAENHTGEIQLLLTDIRMPGKNGAELAEEMLKSRPAIRLLYMTGYADPELLEGHSIDDELLLHKPLEYLLMLGRIRELLDKKNI
ncbi:MAG: GAF domain-containing protein [Elusimicrobiota bacterium]|nr:GAF domain-containing protein [Elusimicrobiota bacterium]